MGITGKSVSTAAEKEIGKIDFLKKINIKKQVMFKIILLAIIVISISFPAFSQKENKRKLIIVTFDGYRWKDIFRGADSALLFAAEKGKKDSAEFINRCWGNNTIERREKLMPFMENIWRKRPQTPIRYGLQ